MGQGLMQSELGTSFYDPEREAGMLNVLQQANQGPFSNETIKALFREVFRAGQGNSMLQVMPDGLDSQGDIGMCIGFHWLISIK